MEINIDGINISTEEVAARMMLDMTISLLHDQIQRLKSNLQVTDIDPNLKTVWEEEIVRLGNVLEELK